MQFLLKLNAAIVKNIIIRCTVSPEFVNNEVEHIHFRNGYWSLKEHKFLERKDLHLVTSYINYDFCTDGFSEAEFIKMKNDLATAFSSTDAFNYFLYIVACSLLGRPLNNFIVLLGKGHNGKTAFCNCLRIVFGPYCVNLSSTC